MGNTINLKVKEVIKETADAVTLRFKQPLFRKVKYESGQFITVILKINGKQERRAYSMCSAPGLESTLDITIKKVAGGIVSNYLNNNIKAGNSIEIMKPMGNFKLTPDKSLKRHIVLFGGGSGITPLMSILKSVLLFEPNSKVSLIYGNENEESIIFKKSLDEYKNKYGDRLDLVHVLNQPSGSWDGEKGLLTIEKTKDIIAKLTANNNYDVSYYMCGPVGMMDIVNETLNSLEIPKAKINQESFVAKENDSVETFDEMSVKIKLSGQEHIVNVPTGKSILDAGLDAGLDMPFSCQSGLCTACMGKCKTGKIKMTENSGLSDQEIEDGFVLLCTGHPMTDDVEVEIG